MYWHNTELPCSLAFMDYKIPSVPDVTLANDFCASSLLCIKASDTRLFNYILGVMVDVQYKLIP